MRTHEIEDNEATQRFAEIAGGLGGLKRTDKGNEIAALRTLVHLWRLGTFEEERGCALRIMERLITEAD